MSANERRRFDVVAIGASAGGVQALLSILPALPVDFAPAMLVVLHVSSERPCALAALLAEHCRLPVSEAFDKQPIEEGTVIVAPPDYHLLVEPDRCISLSSDEPVMFSRPAIDPTFESASLAYRERLLAVLLTGASADGSAGAAKVRSHGGALWVQDPAGAYAPTMPEAALHRAGADAILSLDRIGEGLAGLTR